MLAHLRSRDDWAGKSVAEKGFTLIELLVVIIILGVLAAVAIFALGSINDRAEENACKTEVDTVETAFAAYIAQEGTTPADLAELRTGGNLKKTLKYVTAIDAQGDATASKC